MWCYRSLSTVMSPIEIITSLKVGLSLESSDIQCCINRHISSGIPSTASNRTPPPTLCPLTTCSSVHALYGRSPRVNISQQNTPNDQTSLLVDHSSSSTDSGDIHRNGRPTSRCLQGAYSVAYTSQMAAIFNISALGNMLSQEPRDQITRGVVCNHLHAWPHK